MDGITQAEEAQLRRVYNRLCDYGAKRAVLKTLRPKRERLAQLRLDDEVTAELHHLSRQVDELQAEMTAIEAASLNKITLNDLTEALKALGKKFTKKQIENMIWEVDENLDGCVDWDEMRLMFERNIRDHSGLEPSQLFNMVQFLLYDVDDNRSISVDETMNMLYARYGRVKMEVKLKELFGDDMQETGTQGGEIDFTTYLRAVEKTQLVTFLHSAHGKAQVAKAGSVRKLLGSALDNLS